MLPGSRGSPQRKKRWRNDLKWSRAKCSLWKAIALLLVCMLASIALYRHSTGGSGPSRTAVSNRASQNRRLRGNVLDSKAIEDEFGSTPLFGNSFYDKLPHSEGQQNSQAREESSSPGEEIEPDKQQSSSKHIALAKSGLRSRKTEAQAILGEVPADFDWQSYLVYHPELHNMGITLEAQAKEHYAMHGRHQFLLYRQLRVIMRYTACTGLINQLYSHIAALSLGAILGAEIVLPPAAKRDSFGHYFSVFKEQNEVLWSAAPLESLLDVDNIITFWGDRGLRIHKTHALEPFPDLTEPDAAFIQYPHPGTDERCATKLGGVYLQHLGVDDLVERARKAVVGRAEELMRLEPNMTVEHMVLDLPCTFFMLRSESHLRLVAEVAKSLTWAPQVQQLADRVVRGIKAGGSTDYNSVHLRIEKDARDWSTIMGGEAVVWANYVAAMKEAGFNAGRGLYIASGLLTYGANDEMDHLVSTLKQSGLCQSAHYKELYLPKQDIEALNSEQKALLDFLVLAQGYSFVGFGSSTFSYYLREYRLLVGIPAARSVLVDASVIGTDWLFAEAGKITS